MYGRPLVLFVCLVLWMMADSALRQPSAVAAKQGPAAAVVQDPARRHSMGEAVQTEKMTLEAVRRFNEAFNRHDVDLIMANMTEDCVFENTRPAPDGERHEGQAAVRAVWLELFRRSPQAHFEVEEMFACGDRCLVRWRYAWVREGKAGHVRGVDVFRVKNGKVAEKLSYVKG